MVQTGVDRASLYRIHAQRNRSKLLRNAVGFLQGIIADKRINPVELQALHTYMLDCNDKLDDSDIVDVLDLTQDIVDKAMINQADEHDLKSLIKCILEYRTAEEQAETEALEEFLGICQGIAADGVVNQQEAERAQAWLQRHRELTIEWPCCDIAMRLNKYLADGVLSHAEAGDLYNAMRDLVGGSFVETGTSAFGLPTDLRPHFAQEIAFEDQLFCFTGDFFYGHRTACIAATEKLGGQTTNSISKKVNYLVVGSIGSPFWLTSHFGAKIQKVMKMRDTSFPYLVGEDVWRSYLSQ